MGVLRLLTQGHGHLVTDLEPGLAGCVQVHGQAVLFLVIDHLRQLGHDAPVIARAAVGVAFEVHTRSFDGRVIAQPASVGGLCREQRVVDGALHQVAVPCIAPQPQQAVVDAQLIGGRTRLTQVAATVLVSCPDLALPGSSRDQAAIVVEHELERSFGLLQQSFVRFDPIQLQLGQATRQERVDVPFNSRTPTDDDPQVPIRKRSLLHYKVEV